METIKLYDLFKQLFPLFDVQNYKKVGDYSIKIETTVPGMEFIFTFRSPIDWRLETASMFVKGLEKETIDEFE